MLHFNLKLAQFLQALTMLGDH